MKLDKERQKKVNHITMDMLDMINEHGIKDKETFLSDLSSIICQLDTDIAINVMENFGQEGKNQALTIKVNYGY